MNAGMKKRISGWVLAGLMVLTVLAGSASAQTALNQTALNQTTLAEYGMQFEAARVEAHFGDRTSLDTLTRAMMGEDQGNHR